MNLKNSRCWFTVWAGVALPFLVGLGISSWALPKFLTMYESDPYSNPAWHGRCDTCHINPKGSGPRNAFGQAFERHGETITMELRAAFPDRFLAQPRPSHEPVVEFNQENPNLITVEMNGERIQIDTATKTFHKLESPPAPLPTSSSRGSQENSKASVPTVLDHYFVNLPSAVPYARHSLNMRFTHRFDSAPFDSMRGGGPSNLFGFDGLAISSFGLEYGLTDRIALTAYRSPLYKTVEFGGEISILQESKRLPFSLKALASVEGRNNFKLTVNNRDFFEHFYGGNFQIVISRSIAHRAEFAFVPTFSTNTKVFPDDTNPHKNTVAMGMATSIKLTPHSAIVAEYVPRVGGYEFSGTQPVVSLGIQKSTARHVFALVVSKTQATTTGQQILGGNVFTVGFNIYRRLF
ncbi:MAG: DUF5777 family beta-barrel protein [Acidobacteriia bacterium]|nr:DUF5777 family beta-barrel protein [Terriglobia bacterium]